MKCQNPEDAKPAVHPLRMPMKAMKIMQHTATHSRPATI